MLNDATCFKKIFIVTVYTDLRLGIDRLADTVRSPTVPMVYGRSYYPP
ncbi:hypothetical protein EUBHAL_02902 [Anaerobutyricum hallii DSM 3353]|uniref:Uncharacterized protein n=2 Tax=Anaerobutyricum hallii TaxID=39488 RepID=C0EZP1_9FIRM|nr:hypothetical protein EUBHAL_02902 [Anaerobutyricum hallii DSM 3353]